MRTPVLSELEGGVCPVIETGGWLKPRHSAPSDSLSCLFAVEEPPEVSVFRGQGFIPKSALDPCRPWRDIISDMALARTLFALLIVLSVALLPAAGKAAFQSKSHDMTDMSASAPMDDCCPHAGTPCDKAPADCAWMAACTYSCLNYVRAISSPLVYPVVLAALMPLFESDILPSHAATPPFRPPRV
jgi:hypothetical protein